MESNKQETPWGIVGKTVLSSAMAQLAERSITITNEPQPIPFKLNNYSTDLPTVTGAVFTKPKKPNTGFKLGSYTYKSKRK